MWFHYGWAGIRRGDRVATIAGHPVAHPDSLRPPFWVHDYLERELLCSSQHITPATLPAYRRALADFEPVLLRGYPSSLYLIALHLLEKGSRDVRPRAVYTSSETLLDFQRETIERAFGCKVFSYYSNAERAAHVLQCKAGSFHVVTEAGVVEVLNPDGSAAAPGEPGELVCTGLVDQVMPLIRYRVGDVAVAETARCGCGLSTPILSSIVGRVEDVVVTPDGRHVGRLDHAFKDMLRVKEAQIRQEDLDSITVSLVPRRGFGPDDERALLGALRLRLGPRIAIRVRLVDGIPRAPNGKLRFVVSTVPLQVGRGFGGDASQRREAEALGADRHERHSHETP